MQKKRFYKFDVSVYLWEHKSPKRLTFVNLPGTLDDITFKLQADVVFTTLTKLWWYIPFKMT